MKFRTEIQPLNHRGLIDHSTPIMLLGSCFTTEVGERMQRDLFYVSINPFGTLYNPESIAAAISRIAERRLFQSDDIFEHSGSFHTFHSHSSLSRESVSATLSHHNDTLLSAYDFLKQSRFLIITLGTAWVFRLKSTGSVVANCHKLPANMFLRSRLSVDEATTSLSTAIDTARSVNPDIRIIITVSPIRHAADGLHGNQISKSTLLLAAEQTADHYGCDHVIYFPSYEALIDDLRDYRFYAADMRHPSETAVDYVYEKFGESFFSPSTIALADECRALTRRLAHRTMSASGREKETTVRLNLIKQFKTAHPELLHNIQCLCHTL